MSNTALFSLQYIINILVVYAISPMIAPL